MDDSIEVERIRYAQAYILEILRGYLMSRCTRWIECCGNSDFKNRFSWHLRCSMKSTKLTYGDQIRIGRSSSRNISKCEKTGMIIYLIANRLSFQS
ncbi:hypothetical protein Gotur_015812 [Gossypium turneri]